MPASLVDFTAVARVRVREAPTPGGALDRSSRTHATPAPRALTNAMDRCADGDDGAFREVYDHASPRLFAFFARQTRDRAAAEDLTHEALLRMYSARETFLRGADVWTWAFAIARRLLIDVRRRSKNDPLFARAANDPQLLELVGEASPQDDILLHEMTARLHAELERIPESHRAAFEMIRFDGLSIAQAAEALGASTSATKVRVHRVYERLRTVLTNLMGEAQH